MSTLVLPISKVDDTDPGVDVAVTAVAEETTVLPAGMYKFAAVGTSLKWKLGTSTTITAAIGSYLANGDQEIIVVPDDVADERTVGVIRSTNSVADGSLNIVIANLFTAPGVDPREYA